MTEKDPNGLDPKTAGAKLDHGKDLADMVLGDFAPALDQVAKVGTFGASKYSRHGWKTVDNGVERYANARTRHWLKRHMGEEVDPESGLLHLAHEAWNVLAELTLRLQEELVGAEASTEVHVNLKQGPYAGVEL